MQKTINILFIAILLYGCGKKDGDLSGDSHIRGRLILMDPFSPSPIGTSLAKKIIFISYAGTGDTLDYLFPDTTDANGYFVFQNLKAGQKYRLFYQDSINSILYAAIDSTTAPVDSFALIARLSTTAQNGLWATVTDTLGNALNGVTVYLFKSPGGGYTANTGDGYTYQTTSNPAGYALKFNIFPAVYYILATATVNGLPYIGKDTVIIQDKISPDTVKLNAPNGFQFTILDDQKEILPHDTICVFTNQRFFQGNSCEGSNFSLPVDAAGHANTYNLSPGIYYFYCHFETSKDTLIGVDTRQLGSTIIKDTIILHHK